MFFYLKKRRTPGGDASRAAVLGRCNDDTRTGEEKLGEGNQLFEDRTSQLSPCTK